MKKRLKELINQSEHIKWRYFTAECGKESEAIAMLAILDVLDFIVQEQSLGHKRINLIKKIADAYEI